ncbi:lecithin-cholesterol acyltransferase-like 1 [Nymphaea colorata]|nr:lecithin-cholesterol acyltransferase-like 1 [Nymphaea colorata]
MNPGAVISRYRGRRRMSRGPETITRQTRRSRLLLLLLLLLPLLYVSSPPMTEAPMLIHNGKATSELHPVVLVPGMGGNQLEARLTDAYQPSGAFCRPSAGTRKWFNLWLDLSTLLFPPFTRCFSDRMSLFYDPQTDTYQNAPGVETRVPHFGSTRALKYLSLGFPQHVTSYMAPLVKALEGIGYIDEQTLFGAPYDFRHGPSNFRSPSVGSQFLADLKGLVEKASSSNGGKKVILISHSLGGLWTLHLLNRSPLTWRQKYVRHFIALTPPWAGTVQELLALASGYTLGLPLVNPLLVRAQQRRSESNLWLLPSPPTFRHKPLVITPYRTYLASNLSEFLADIGFPEGMHPYRSRILPLMSDQLAAPLVPVTLVVGTEVETPEALVYDEHGFDKQPEIVFGDGDGTVNLKSMLAVVSAWEGVENQSLKVTKLRRVSHLSVLKDEFSVREILQEVSSINHSLA